MKIEIDPNETLPSGQSVLEAAAEIAGRQICDYVIEQGGKDLQDRIHEAREEAISSKVPAMVAEVMEGPLTLTDNYGTKREVTTLRELVAQTALNALERPVKNSYRYVSGHAIDDKDTRSLVEYFVARYVRSELENQIKEIASNVVKVTSWGQQLSDDIHNSLTAALEDTAKKLRKERRRA